MMTVLGLLPAFSPSVLASDEFQSATAMERNALRPQLAVLRPWSERCLRAQ